VTRARRRHALRQQRRRARDAFLTIRRWVSAGVVSPEVLSPEERARFTPEGFARGLAAIRSAPIRPTTFALPQSAIDDGVLVVTREVSLSPEERARIVESIDQHMRYLLDTDARTIRITIPYQIGDPVE